MEFTKEALQYLMDLTVKPDERVVDLVDDNGLKRIFTFNSNGTAAEIEPNVPYRAKESIRVHTLNGLCEYIESQLERHDVPLFIQIEDERTVSLLGTLDAEGKRERLVMANAIVPDFHYDLFMDSETLIIKLQAQFATSEDREILLQVLGNIKEENVRTVGDDGISQAVKIKQGLTSVADVIVPNPVNLAPYRTFLEVDQPFSDFIFRMKDGPKGALFEADGGVWRNDAITNIANYLHDRLIGEPAERGEEPFNVTIIA